jgi:hypothetical protein
VVSVVTRGVPDDANAFVVPERSVWLRVSASTASTLTTPPPTETRGG